MCSEQMPMRARYGAFVPSTFCKLTASQQHHTVRNWNLVKSLPWTITSTHQWEPLQEDPSLLRTTPAHASLARQHPQWSKRYCDWSRKPLVWSCSHPDRGLMQACGSLWWSHCLAGHDRYHPKRTPVWDKWDRANNASSCMFFGYH